MKGGYLKLVKYTYGRKSHGDGGFRRVRRRRGVEKEEWGWAIGLGEYCNLGDCIRSEDGAKKGVSLGYSVV